MTIRHGDRIGPYEVVALVDSGAQGEVYLARDTRLARDVALKVVAGERLDQRRLARFEREAAALGALNHPNIATLFGVEYADGVAALAMEYVEGESLAARLAGGAVPVDECLRVARQIADALEAAHGQGILHRDLKPANVMIRRDGAIKLLDFGLAKPTADRAARTTTATVTDSDGGLAIVGTAAYLSPEQARGGNVDRRTDVWAFGCVLYEMLTGRRAFDGATSSDTIAGVLGREPDLGALPPETTGSIRRLIRRCLQKDANDRLRDIGDARLEIDDALNLRDAPGPGPRSRWSAWRYAAAMAAGAVATAVVLSVAAPHRSAQPAVSRLSVVFPGGGSRYGVAIAPDGARIAYVTPRGLAVKPRDRLTADLLLDKGTFPTGPFFSPDGHWLGFVDGSDLKRVPVAGGAPTTIAAVSPGATASWGPDGVVVADLRGLFLVSPDGGEPRQLRTAAIGAAERPAYPQMLPGRRGVVFTVLPAHTLVMRGYTPAGARIDVIDLRTGAQRTLVRGGGRAMVLPTGHLVYSSGQRLLGVRFDPDRLEISGEPVELEAGRVGEYSVSDDGTLLFRSEADLPATLVWVDRAGREEPVGAPARHYVYPRLSPNGDRIALVLFDGNNRDVDVWDMKRRTLVRFTPDPADNGLAAWSPDATRLAFSSDRLGPPNLFWQASDGSGVAEYLRKSDHLNQPIAFTPDGRLFFSAEVPGHGRDIHALTLATREIEPVVSSPASELNAVVSPDGRWLAYDSNESGQFEIYVQPYPTTAGGRRWQVSAGGGRQPLWARDGRELYYRDFEGDVMGCPVAEGATFTPGALAKVVEGAGYVGGGSMGGGTTYDVARDGRFLMIKGQPIGDGTTWPLTVVQNWFEEVKRLLPGN